MKDHASPDRSENVTPVAARRRNGLADVETGTPPSPWDAIEQYIAGSRNPYRAGTGTGASQGTQEPVDEEALEYFAKVFRESRTCEERQVTGEQARLNAAENRAWLSAGSRRLGRTIRNATAAALVGATVALAGCLGLPRAVRELVPAVQRIEKTTRHRIGTVCYWTGAAAAGCALAVACAAAWKRRRLTNLLRG
ncbi:MAG: hypothetical protein JXR37_11650 [Kiritimatiellae bacterium]|nr:hypothetical protein [Kiritimatiellia bacterium]